MEANDDSNTTSSDGDDMCQIFQKRYDVLGQETIIAIVSFDRSGRNPHMKNG